MPDTFWGNVKRYTRWIPIIGEPNCPYEAIKSALYEVIISTIFATVPVWFLPVFGLFFLKNPTTVSEAVRTGELFIYSTALAGPLLYTITKRYGDYSIKRGLLLTISFPHGILFVCSTAFMCLLSGFAFTLLKNPQISTGDGGSQLNHSGIVLLSWLILFISTLIFFCVTTYKNMLDGAVRDGFPKQTDEFVDAWMNRTGHEQ